MTFTGAANLVRQPGTHRVSRGNSDIRQSGAQAETPEQRRQRNAANALGCRVSTVLACVAAARVALFAARGSRRGLACSGTCGRLLRRSITNLLNGSALSRGLSGMGRAR